MQPTTRSHHSSHWAATGLQADRSLNVPDAAASAKNEGLDPEEELLSAAKLKSVTSINGL